MRIFGCAEAAGGHPAEEDGGAALAQEARYVYDDTIVSVAPSDIQKPYAQEGGMPLLDKVRDGSEGCLGENLGYHLCFAVACPGMSRRIVPLRATMWSAKEEGFMSENDKVKAVVRDVVAAAGRRGIYVYDRGGDGDRVLIGVSVRPCFASLI